MGRFTDLLTGAAPPPEDPTARPALPQEPQPQAPQPQAPPPESPVQPTRRFTDMLIGEPDRPAPSPQPEKSFFEKVSSLITGEGQFTEDLPELGTSGPQVPPFSPEGIKMAMGYATSVNPEGVADIAVKTLSGATRSEDEFGNPIIEFNGQKFFVNRPGFSEADMFKFVADVVQFAPAAKVTAFFKGITQRMAAGFTTAMATSLAQDQAAAGLGSEQGTQLGQAGTVGAFAAVAEGISPVITRVVRAVSQNPAVRRLLGRSLVESDGTLNEQGARIVAEAGEDPSLFTPEMGRELDQLASRLGKQFEKEGVRATKVPAAAAGAQARELGIDLTLGQATKDVRQIAREEAMRNFARGRGAGNIVQAFDQKQRKQIEAALSRAQGNLSGAPQATVPDPVDVAAQISDRIKGTAATLDEQIDAAYRAADELTASLSPESLANLPKFVRSRLRAESVPLFGETPAANQAMKIIGNLAQTGGLKRVKEVKFLTLELRRRELNALFNAAKNPTDRRALTIIKNQYDDFIEDAFDNGMFSGDPEFLDAIKEARALRAEKGSLLSMEGSADDAGRLLDKIVDLDVTNLEVANWLFGTSKVGQVPRSLRLVKRIQRIFGKSSREWQLLREGAFMRSVYGAKGVAGTIGNQQLKSNLDEALSPNSRQFMKELFSDSEMKGIARLRNAIADTITPREAANPSRTGFEVARAFEDLMTKFAGLAAVTAGGAKGAAAAGVAAGVRSVTRRGAARKAVQGFTLPPIQPIPLTGVGAAIGQQVPEQQGDPRDIPAP